jgi:hypothetical protein
MRKEHFGSENNVEISGKDLIQTDSFK